MRIRVRVYGASRAYASYYVRAWAYARDVSFNELKCKSVSFLASAGLPLALALSSANNKKMFF